jgi:hypothetical protein
VVEEEPEDEGGGYTANNVRRQVQRKMARLRANADAFEEFRRNVGEGGGDLLFARLPLFFLLPLSNFSHVFKSPPPPSHLFSRYNEGAADGGGGYDHPKQARRMDAKHVKEVRAHSLTGKDAKAFFSFFFLKKK